MRANAKLSSLVFVRILCLLSALVIGPFIGATITTVVTFVAPETFGAAPVDASMALAMWAMFTFGAMFFGAPLALGAIVLMIPFLWRPRLSLSLVLATTALSVIAAKLLGSNIQLLEEFSIDQSLEEFSMDIAIMLALSLTSAAICWRLTKRWHSPA